MDKRAAKREACWRVAGMAQGTLDAGYVEGIDADNADREKIHEQILVLIEELERRGHL